MYNCVKCQLITITVGSGAHIAGSRVAAAVVASAATAAVDVTAVTTAAADRITASKFLLAFSCIKGFV